MVCCKAPLSCSPSLCEQGCPQQSVICVRSAIEMFIMTLTSAQIYCSPNVYALTDRHCPTLNHLVRNSPPPISLCSGYVCRLDRNPEPPHGVGPSRRSRDLGVCRCRRFLFIFCCFIPRYASARLSQTCFGSGSSRRPSCRP